MFDEKEFGKSVKRIRKLLCIKSYDFAIAANLNYTYLSNIENNKSIPTAKTAISILNTLNMTYEECINSDSFRIKETYKNIISNIINSMTEEDLIFLLQLIRIFKTNQEEE